MACSGLNSLSGSHQRDASALNLSISAGSTLTLVTVEAVMAHPKKLRPRKSGALIVALATEIRDAARITCGCPRFRFLRDGFEHGLRGSCWTPLAELRPCLRCRYGLQVRPC